MRLDEMAAVCRPVRFADNHVRVHLWFALVKRNITHQRQDFDLLGKRNALVIFCTFHRITWWSVSSLIASRPR